MDSSYPQGRDGFPSVPWRSYLERDLEIGFTPEAGSADSVSLLRKERCQPEATDTHSEPSGKCPHPPECGARPEWDCAVERDVLVSGASHRPFGSGERSARFVLAFVV